MSRPRVRISPWRDADGTERRGIEIRRDRAFVWVPFNSAHEIADQLIDLYEQSLIEEEAL